MAASAIGAIAQTIQLSVTPVFLLVATGSLLNVFTGRLARVVDRSRALMDRWANSEGPEHERIVAELRVVDRRINVINNSIGAAVACGDASCKDGSETLASFCDGAGGCTTVPSVNCEPFACGEVSCKRACAVDFDCASGYSCDARTGRCVFGAKCDGDHTVVVPSAASNITSCRFTMSLTTTLPFGSCRAATALPSTGFDAASGALMSRTGGGEDCCAAKGAAANNNGMKFRMVV